jgi:hypothetical protein
MDRARDLGGTGTRHVIRLKYVRMRQPEERDRRPRRGSPVAATKVRAFRRDISQTRHCDPVVAVVNTSAAGPGAVAG